jgi:hypothetical protein
MLFFFSFFSLMILPYPSYYYGPYHTAHTIYKQACAALVNIALTDSTNRTKFVSVGVCEVLVTVLAKFVEIQQHTIVENVSTTIPSWRCLRH